MGVAMRMAIKKLMPPVNPNSMERVAPKRPEMMPRGKPKFNPQPEWIMGTMARTMMAFQLKRLMVLLIWIQKPAPTKGAAIYSISRKAAMIKRGSPKLLTKLWIRSRSVRLDLSNGSYMLSLLTLPC